jgi:hypothetical protein
MKGQICFEHALSFLLEAMMLSFGKQSFSLAADLTGNRICYLTAGAKVACTALTVQVRITRDSECANATNDCS